MHVNQWLEALPPLAICLVVGSLVMIENFGVPIPGELVLITAALLCSTHKIGVSPVWIGVSASTGAIVGGSVGFAVGRRWGEPLFDWLGRKVPKHFGPAHVAYAEKVFARWGALAVFFGRFVALLRIFAGPLSGALGMPLPRFLAANAAGAICWAGGMTAAIFYLGEVADAWFNRFSWIALAVTLVIGLAISLFIKRRTAAAAEREHAKS